MEENKYKALKINGKRIDEHRLVWMQHYGEIPEGYVIHHKDENKSNNDISNLEMMTHEDHVSLHSKGVTKSNRETHPEWYEKLKERQKSKRIVSDDENLSWCNIGEHFAPIDEFSKDKYRWNGLDARCKKCRGKYRSKKD